jgi:hypothetical protein
MRTCRAVGEIGKLDAVLGPDIDVATEKTRDEKRGNAVGQVAKSVINSFIPFGGIIRASRCGFEERQWQVALYAPPPRLPRKVMARHAAAATRHALRRTGSGTPAWPERARARHEHRRPHRHRRRRHPQAPLDQSRWRERPVEFAFGLVERGHACARALAGMSFLRIISARASARSGCASAMLARASAMLSATWRPISARSTSSRWGGLGGSGGLGR